MEHVPRAVYYFSRSARRPWLPACLTLPPSGNSTRPLPLSRPRRGLARSGVGCVVGDISEYAELSMRRSAVHPITCVQKFAQILSCRGTMKKQLHRVGKDYTTRSGS